MAKETESVKIDTGVLDLVRKHKGATGFPFGRFIEDAIVEKVDRLPDELKVRMGVKKSKKK